MGGKAAAAGPVELPAKRKTPYGKRVAETIRDFQRRTGRLFFWDFRGDGVHVTRLR